MCIIKKKMKKESYDLITRAERSEVAFGCQQTYPKMIVTISIFA